MNNILELYDIEFKRIKKPYFLLILFLILSNIFIFTYKIFAYTNVYNFNFIEAINKLKLVLDVNNSFIIDTIDVYNALFIGLIFLILIYSIVIWYRDFFFKEKTAYVLYLLPQNKMNIFFSKLLIIVNIIYTFTFIQIILYLINNLFLNNVLGLDIDIYYYSFPMMFDFRGFFVVNILGVVCAISVLFMCTLLSLYNKKLGSLSFFVLIILFTALYTYLYSLNGNISITILHSVYLILLILFSIFVSSKLINKIDF